MDAGYAVSPDEETSPGSDTTYPHRIQGKIFAHEARGDLSCSGTVVTSPRRNLVITAGHCVFDTQKRQYVTNWVFIPGYRNGKAPLGVWPANNLFALNGWTGAGGAPCCGWSNDIGMATLGPRGGRQIETEFGSRGIVFNQPPQQTFEMFGYPERPNLQDDGFGDYDGERLIRCPNVTTQKAENQGDGYSLGVAYCFMQQGSSGGGWIIGGVPGYLNSVMSHGYCPEDPSHAVWDPNTQTGKCGMAYGPYFGDGAANLYKAATTTPPPVDRTPPALTALQSSGRHGAVMRLRYRVRDDRGVTAETVNIFRAGQRVAQRTSPFGPTTLSPFHYVSWRVPNSGSKFSFCVRSRDRAGNKSARSCARVVLTG
jgi:hypothetical protein